MTNLFFSDWMFIVFNCCLYKRIIAGLWSRDNERNWENLNSFKREQTTISNSYCCSCKDEKISLWIRPKAFLGVLLRITLTGYFIT